MGLQLIFVVECDKNSESDWIYIKETIGYFYETIGPQIKLNHVYMEGRGNYKNNKTINDIKKKISQYRATNRSNISKVIYCFDCDDYDIKPSDAKFLENAFQYCQERDYEFIWFCKDVERVYIGRKVDDRQKTNEAARFKKKSLILHVNKCNLVASQYQRNSSNILKVLDKQL